MATAAADRDVAGTPAAKPKAAPVERQTASAQRKARRLGREQEQVRAEAAEKAAHRSLERRFGAASRRIGLVGTSEHFECSECGRWADVLVAAKVYSRLVDTELRFSLPDWQCVITEAGMLRFGERHPGGVRPAYLQREFAKDYDESVRIFETAVRLGFLDAAGQGVVAAHPKCSDCYERRAAATEPEEPTPKPREPIPPQLHFRVLQRDGFRCQYCGRSAHDGATLHLDHVVPVSAGGETSENNLIAACETCNIGKSVGDVV